MPKRRFVPVLAGLATALLLAGCGSSDSTGPTTDLAGSYTLQALTISGQSVPVPTFATGTLVLTATTYNVNVAVTIPGQETTYADQGTYTVSGSTWTQTSTVTQGQVTTGTYSQSGNTLTVNVEVEGQATSMVWAK